MGGVVTTAPRRISAAPSPTPRERPTRGVSFEENLAGKAARYADVIDIQAQTFEPRGYRAYGNFVRRAAAQAKAANPDVVVLGNISASPDGTAVDAAAMYGCAKAAMPYVSGFYTTVSAADGSTTASFLRRLGA